MLLGMAIPVVEFQNLGYKIRLPYFHKKFHFEDVGCKNMKMYINNKKWTFIEKWPFPEKWFTFRTCFLEHVLGNGVRML